jgi:radical SAM protein with 4Fe4S-binding SPASM domain
MRNILSSNQISKIVRSQIVNNRLLGLPDFVQIEVTTKCNLRCKMCMKSMEEGALNSDMTLSLFDSIMGRLKYPTQFVNLVGLGEPLLNPQIFSMIKHAKSRGLKVSLIDNFVLVDRDVSLSLIESGLDYLFVSIDSASKSTFEKFRTGASFDKVIENIKLFVATKNQAKTKRPLLIFKTTVSKDNISEIPQLIQLGEKLGADGFDFGKLISQEDTYVNDSSLSLSIEDLPKSKLSIDLCEMSKTYDCTAKKGCFITFDGKVLPCGHTEEILPRKRWSELQFGDLTRESIDKIWRSANHRQFRSELKSGERLASCKKCPAWRQGFKIKPCVK